MKTYNPDPVHEKNDQWYFYDETWTDRIGPYKNEEEARHGLELYFDELNFGTVCGACGNPNIVEEKYIHNTKPTIRLCSVCAKTAKLNGYAPEKKLCKYNDCVNYSEKATTYCCNGCDWDDQDQAQLEQEKKLPRCPINPTLWGSWKTSRSLGIKSKK